MRLKMKNRSQRKDRDKFRLRHGHKYTELKIVSV